MMALSRPVLAFVPWCLMYVSALVESLICPRCVINRICHVTGVTTHVCHVPGVMTRVCNCVPGVSRPGYVMPRVS